MDYFYIRDNFSTEDTNHNILSIQLSLDGFSFLVVPHSNPDIILYLNQKKFDTQGTVSLFHELNNFREFYHKVFHSINIIFHTDKFCLIPDNIYYSGIENDIMRLSHPADVGVNIALTLIPAINARAAFLLPEELSELISNKYAGAALYHSSLPIISYGMKMQEKCCIVYYQGSLLSVAIFESKILKLLNIYMVQNQDDIIYYILTALRSCNMSIPETRMHIAGSGLIYPSVLMDLTKRSLNPVPYVPDLSEPEKLNFPGSILFNHLETLSCASSVENTGEKP